MNPSVSDLLVSSIVIGSTLLGFALLEAFVVRELGSHEHHAWWVNFLSRLVGALVLVVLLFAPWRPINWLGLLAAGMVLVDRVICSIRFLLLAKPVVRFLKLRGGSFNRQIAGYLYYILIPMARRFAYFILLAALIATVSERLTETPLYLVSSPSSVSFVDFLYFVVATATTLGFGDIVPITVVSKGFTTFIVLTGIYFLSVGFATTIVFFSRLINELTVTDVKRDSDP